HHLGHTQQHEPQQHVHEEDPRCGRCGPRDEETCATEKHQHATGVSEHAAAYHPRGHLLPHEREVVVDEGKDREADHRHREEVTSRSDAAKAEPPVGVWARADAARTAGRETNRCAPRGGEPLARQKSEPRTAATGQLRRYEAPFTSTIAPVMLTGASSTQ